MVMITMMVIIEKMIIIIIQMLKVDTNDNKDEDDDDAVTKSKEVSRLFISNKISLFFWHLDYLDDDNENDEKDNDDFDDNEDDKAVLCDSPRCQEIYFSIMNMLDKNQLQKLNKTRLTNSDHMLT